MKKFGQKVNKALIRAVKIQLKENNPRETRQAYMRLLGDGITEENAYIYLAQALASEMLAMMKEKRAYDSENYTKLLAKLPNLD